LEKEMASGMRNRSRKSSFGWIIVAWVMLICPGFSSAAVLGEITVESVLNQPFFARIEIISGGEDPYLWEIGLGTEEEYRSLELQRADHLAELRATLVERPGRAPEIYVEGRSPMRELIVDLVVVIRSNGNARLRYYPVLVDFPALETPQVAPQPVRTIPPRRPVSPPPPRPVAEVNIQAGDQTYRIVSGDTLYAIAKRVGAGSGMNLNDVMDALFALNPEAFIREDINMIRAGAVLRLPDLVGASVAAAPTASSSDRSTSAGGERQEATSSAIAGDSASQLARLELRGSPDTETIVDSLATWLDASDSETSARVGEVRRDLAFAAAEIETYKKENELLKSRIEGLEERVLEMERLLTLQTSLISSLEVESGERQASADTAPPAAEIPDEAAAQIPDDVSLAGPSDEVVAVADEGEFDSGWILFPAAAAALLFGFGLLVFFRSVREDRLRSRRAAELTSRLRDEPERSVLPEDL
jgi:pilus assembly protein FimV